MPPHSASVDQSVGLHDLFQKNPIAIIATLIAVTISTAIIFLHVCRVALVTVKKFYVNKVFKNKYRF